MKGGGPNGLVYVGVLAAAAALWLKMMWLCLVCPVVQSVRLVSCRILVVGLLGWVIVMLTEVASVSLLVGSVIWAVVTVVWTVLVCAEVRLLLTFWTVSMNLLLLQWVMRLLCCSTWCSILVMVIR